MKITLMAAMLTVLVLSGCTAYQAIIAQRGAEVSDAASEKRMAACGGFPGHGRGAVPPGESL